MKKISLFIVNYSVFRLFTYLIKRAFNIDFIKTYDTSEYLTSVRSKLEEQFSS